MRAFIRSLAVILAVVLAGACSSTVSPHPPSSGSPSATGGGSATAGGKVEWCAPGSEAVCQVAASVVASPGASPGASTTPAPHPDVDVTASASQAGSPPENAFDGSTDTSWIAGAGAPQWIQVDHASPRTVAGLRLVVAQTPSGPTVHQVLVGTGGGGLKQVGDLKGTTADGQQLVWTPSAPLQNVTTIQILTTTSPSWVAWREIGVVGP